MALSKGEEKKQQEAELYWDKKMGNYDWIGISQKEGGRDLGVFP